MLFISRSKCVLLVVVALIIALVSSIELIKGVVEHGPAEWAADHGMENSTSSPTRSATSTPASALEATNGTEKLVLASISPNPSSLIAARTPHRNKLFLSNETVKPILYLHFHKAGGTDVCDSMLYYSTIRLTNLKWRRPPGTRNCNAEGYGPYTDPRMNDADATLKCEGLIPYTVDRNGTAFRRHNFLGIEIPIDEPFPCPGFRNFALMRDPITRIYSHMKVRRWTEASVHESVLYHRKRWGLGTEHAINLKFAAGEGTRLGRNPSHKTPFVMRPFPSINNMIIRQLIGLGTIQHDRRDVNEDDLELAKRVVDEFTAFVPTEKQDDPIVRALLQRELPEFVDAHTKWAIAESRKKKKKSPSRYQPSAAFTEFLRQENKYDLLLYKYVHEKLGIAYSPSATPASVSTNAASSPASREAEKGPLASNSASLSDARSGEQEYFAPPNELFLSNETVKPILYLHFHKAGGTDVCDSMLDFSSIRLTNLQWQKPLSDRNCNAVGYGPYTDPRMDDENATLKCEGLVPYTVDRNGTAFRRHNFLGIEIPIDEPMPCPGFRNFALMRNPITRIYSHMKVRKWSEASVHESVLYHRKQWGLDTEHASNLTFPPGEGLRNLDRKPSHKTPFVMRPFPSINNMIIRQLIGLGTFEHDKRAVNEDDLELAKRVVDEFTAFVPTEKQDDPKIRALLQKELPEFVDAHRKWVIAESTKKKQKSPSHYQPSAAFTEFLRQENKYDLLLYEYVHEKLGLAYGPTR